MPPSPVLAEDPPPEVDLSALRAEIDALDDALHDLLMRRVQVVARLAASRAKGQGPALRPGREAAILRRLLARHQGPLPRQVLVRLWRELLAATTSLQAPLSVAAWLPPAGVAVLREHIGVSGQIAPCATEEAALAAQAEDRAALVALPPGGRWWRSALPNLFVTAKLPFLGPADTTVFLLSPTPPDASGDDHTLVRLPAGAEARLAGADLRPAVLLREDDLLLAELPGMIAPDDVRLAGTGALILGAYATPVTD